MTSSAGPGCHPVFSWTGHGPVSGKSFDTVSPASTSAHTQQSGHPYGAPCKTCDRALGGQNCCICDNTFGSILEGCLQAYNKKYLPHRFATCLELRDSAVFTRLCRLHETLLPSQNGLYATRDIPPGVWIASFGKCKTVAGPHVQTEYGYTFPCRGTEVGGSCVQWVTPVAILQKDELAHAINHTCDEDKIDVELVNTDVRIARVGAMCMSPL